MPNVALRASAALPARRSLLVLAVLLGGVASATAALVPEHVAQSVGLTRAWHTQASLDPATQTLVNAVLADDAIVILTSAGKLQAIRSETGAPIWEERLGERSTTVLGPSVGAGQVAAIVGSTLYVCDLATGRRVLTRKIEAAPGGPPAVDADRAYVPLLRGKLAAYPLDSTIDPPFRVASPGQLLHEPKVVADQVIWATSRGELYAASTGDGAASYRMKVTAPLAGTPGHIERDVYFATTDGHVYAINGQRGRMIWRRPIGTSIDLPPVGVAGTVFVGDRTNRLHAFEPESGKLRWTFEGADLFVSATAERVYAVDPNGGLVALDRETGRLIAAWPPAGRLLPVTNTITDRLYFVSSDGLVQAFHEIDREKPFRHGEEPAADEAADAADKPADTPAVDAAPPAVDEPLVDEPDDEPDAGDDPFADPFAPADGGDEAADEDDPFAF